MKTKRLYFAQIHGISNPTIPDRERNANGIYPGDNINYNILCSRYNGNEGSRGPWMCNLSWPGELSVPIDGSGVDEGTAALLFGLVMALRPRVVLETGTRSEERRVGK